MDFDGVPPNQEAWLAAMKNTVPPGVTKEQGLFKNDAWVYLVDPINHGVWRTEYVDGVLSDVYDPVPRVGY